jgi:lipopolysaccharide/colanic/teichoic acid biosynthesis glycosyltransferase
VHEDWQRRRLDVRPGCTGLWQVRGRSAVGFQDMVLLDLYYIANWTLGLDLALILRTVPVMLAARGGH